MCEKFGLSLLLVVALLPACGRNDAGSSIASPPSEPAKQPLRSLNEVNAARAQGTIDLSRLQGTIVFVSDRSSILKIWTMQPSGENARQLARDSNPDADPRFSPNGKHILYTSLRCGLPEIWRMNRNGSDPRFVTKGGQASWAPNGQSIVFIRDNQTYVRNLESGKERCVTPANPQPYAGPAWSPDGKQLAVASRHLGSISIFLVDGEGTAAAPLKTEEPCSTPRWSPDGKRILCQTVQGHICQVDRDGKNWEQLTFGADLQHNACYSPDGSMILFCRASDPEGPWQICVKKLDGDEYDFTQLTREGTNLSPDWHAAER